MKSKVRDKKSKTKSMSKEKKERQTAAIVNYYIKKREENKRAVKTRK